MNGCNIKKVSISVALLIILTSQTLTAQTSNKNKDDGTSNIEYGNLVRNSLMFLALEHGYRISYEERTREQLRQGNFFSDWIRSTQIRGWDDGGKFFTNYIAHPMQGSVSAAIFANNDKVSQEAEFWTKSYFRAKKRQFVFATIYSWQFEFGPISENSIGNVGLRGKQTWVDNIITAPIGIAWSTGEDVANHFIVCRLKRKHPVWANTLAIFTTPTRSLANITAFKTPWHRKTCPTR